MQRLSSDWRATLDHRPDYINKHRLYASQRKQACQVCYEESFCADCHANKKEEIKPSDQCKDSPKRTLPRRGDYHARHKIDGRINPASCFPGHAVRIMRGAYHATNDKAFDPGSSRIRRAPGSCRLQQSEYSVRIQSRHRQACSTVEHRPPDRIPQRPGHLRRLPWKRPQGRCFQRQLLFGKFFRNDLSRKTAHQAIRPAGRTRTPTAQSQRALQAPHSDSVSVRSVMEMILPAVWLRDPV